MLKIKLVSLQPSDLPKTYKVIDGVLYINDEPVVIDISDGSVCDYGASEDFRSIKRSVPNGDVVAELYVFASPASIKSYFSCLKIEGAVEDTVLPYDFTVGKTVSLETLEGAEW